MTAYAGPSNQAIDPLKQAGQMPSTYPVEPESQELATVPAKHTSTMVEHLDGVSPKAGWPLKQAGQVSPTYTAEVEAQKPTDVPAKPTMAERFHRISSKAAWPLKQAGQVSPRDTAEPESQEPILVPAKRTTGDHIHGISSKAAWPFNKAANMVGAEGWWPTSMDKECNKAARILHSFTTLSSPTPPKASGPLHPTGLTRKSMVKIPPQILQRAAGFAIFNVLRAGAGHGSLAAGSGLVIARRPDGTWSPPSAFVVSTIGAGLVIGIDVYDCVCVLNTPEQVSAFTNPRVSLGAEGSIAIGPLGTGGCVETALGETSKPMWSYMKNRGLWVGVQIDGTFIISRDDANAAFYNERGITADRILNEDVAWPMDAKPLFEVLRALGGHERTVADIVLPPGHAVLSEKKERYAYMPEQERAVSVDENKEEGPSYRDVESNSKEEEEYDMVVDEKERFAKFK
ncbi:hypothetical protein FZEAL_1182 [Fusarium zealandicum]|uniref:Ysc84 actin-binding domain-containing protein n=1 Tax=Fusarium zealandicum TaxID=1053134 RepID=A0A8H4XPM7_9HYPO|nr:hypothetical protein FZEAL_1182 [Fusarium zealandicum]